LMGEMAETGATVASTRGPRTLLSPVCLTAWAARAATMAAEAPAGAVAPWRRHFATSFMVNALRPARRSVQARTAETTAAAGAVAAAWGRLAAPRWACACLRPGAVTRCTTRPATSAIVAAARRIPTASLLASPCRDVPRPRPAAPLGNACPSRLRAGVASRLSMVRGTPAIAAAGRWTLTVRWLAFPYAVATAATPAVTGPGAASAPRAVAPRSAGTMAVEGLAVAAQTP